MVIITAANFTIAINTNLDVCLLRVVAILRAAYRALNVPHLLHPSQVVDFSETVTWYMLLLEIYAPDYEHAEVTVGALVQVPFLEMRCRVSSRPSSTETSGAQHCSALSPYPDMLISAQLKSRSH